MTEVQMIMHMDRIGSEKMHQASTDG